MMNIADIDLINDIEDVYKYFDQTGILHWCAAADEGKSILAKCLGFHVQNESPIDQVISGVAAASYDGALMLVAKMLGLDFDALLREVSYWEEDRDKPAISFDDLVKRLAARTDGRFLPELIRCQTSTDKPPLPADFQPVPTTTEGI